MRKVLLMTLVVGLLTVSQARARRLRVGVAGSPPFVVWRGQTCDGLSVRIWQELARDQNITYHLVRMRTVADALHAVHDGTVDMAIGPISITSRRAEIVSFTQPYFKASLGLLSRARKTGPLAWLKGFFSTTFLVAVCFLLGLLLLVGGLIWLSEREANPEQFPPGPGGIANGMWFAIVTMTTVGYGDRVPTTRWGRVLTGVWMLIATISFSTLTAGIASAMTVSHLSKAAITSPEMMAGRYAAVVAGTTGANAARRFDAHLVMTSGVAEAVERLKQGRADVVVFDHPQLQYYLAKHPDPKLSLARSHFDTQNYGFALPVRSPLTHKLNVSLLRLDETGRIQQIEDRWLADVQG